MAKKIKLLGIGKSEHHNYYIFQKKQEFFELVRQLLKRLGFRQFEWDGFGRPLDKELGEPDFEKEENIEDYIDERKAFEKEDYYIEIVFGKEKIFVMIHTKKDDQNMLADIIREFVFWPS